MTKRTLIALAVVATLAVAMVPLVNAQGRRHHGGEGLMALGRLEVAREALGLTDQQVTQLKTIASDLRAQNAPYREQLRGGIAAVAQTLVANPSDLAAAQALLDKQTDAERTMKLNTLTAASKALSLLTPDQRAKVGTFIAARQKNHSKDND
ncbi:MAG: periplasmic heavy metal sensor [Acidobacteriota bacterium]